ncbi:unnamed protein product [Calypogeia fissa]
MDASIWPEYKKSWVVFKLDLLTSLWPQFHNGDHFDQGQYLLGDNGYVRGYVALPHLVAAYRQLVQGKDNQDFNFCVIAKNRIRQWPLHWGSHVKVALVVRDSRRMVKRLDVCVMLHNYVLNRNGEWTEEDQRIVLERDSQTGVPKEDLEACIRQPVGNLLRQGRKIKERTLVFFIFLDIGH